MSKFSQEWNASITAYLNAERAAGRAASTIYTRTQHLQRLAKGLGRCPSEVTVEMLFSWFAHHRHWALETRRGYRNTTRLFFAWAHRHGHTATNPAIDLPTVRPSLPNPRPVPDFVYARALAAGDERDRLILRMAAELGMRRAEVAHAHSDDLIAESEGWSLIVHGKGNKTRIVPLPYALAVEMRALPPGWFFPGNFEGHLSPRWVGTLAARLMPDGWTMHKLRHRFATRAYAVDRDLLTVQELLGHASPSTTQAYVAVPRSSLRDTVNAAR